MTNRQEQNRKTVVFNVTKKIKIKDFSKKYTIFVFGKSYLFLRC